MFKMLSSDSNLTVSVFIRIREKKNKEKTAEMTLLKIIDLFQSFNSLYHFVLISLSNSDNSDIVLSESVNLVNLNLFINFINSKSSHLSDSDSSHQSDSKYHDDSNTSALFTHISMTEKVSHNIKLFEIHFRMTDNNNNNIDQSY